RSYRGRGSQGVSRVSDEGSGWRDRDGAVLRTDSLIAPRGAAATAGAYRAASPKCTPAAGDWGAASGKQDLTGCTHRTERGLGGSGSAVRGSGSAYGHLSPSLRVPGE